MSKIEYDWDAIMTPAKEDAIRQWCLKKYHSRFKKGIKMIEAKDGFVEVWGISSGPLYLSATFVREFNV